MIIKLQDDARHSRGCQQQQASHEQLIAVYQGVHHKDVMHMLLLYILLVDVYLYSYIG
jgi:hypothetical protein